MSGTASIRPATTRLCSLDQRNHSFLAHAVSIERLIVAVKALFIPPGKRQWNMSHTARNSIPKLRKAPQPSLSRPGATPDSDCPKKPSLAELSAGEQELSPGDRVEGLGDFGKPTEEFGTG